MKRIRFKKYLQPQLIHKIKYEYEGVISQSLGDGIAGSYEDGDTGSGAGSYDDENL